MQDLLLYILKNITTHPDEVRVDVGTEEDREVYTITVNPEDMGRVIGKNGKVIKAIRSLAHVVAIRQGKRFRINLAEIEGQPGSVEEETSEEKAVEPTEEITSTEEASEAAEKVDSTKEVAEPAENDDLSDVIDLSQDEEEK